jgi:two-component system sensor histidine kinase/response regulator
MPSYCASDVHQTKPLILVVDAHEVIGELLQKQLSKGFTVRVAHSGKDAIEFCDKHAPNLILMDMYMPEMDGIEVSRKINGQRLAIPIPVVFLTEAECI